MLLREGSDGVLLEGAGAAQGDALRSHFFIGGGRFRQVVEAHQHVDHDRSKTVPERVWKRDIRMWRETGVCGGNWGVLMLDLPHSPRILPPMLRYLACIAAATTLVHAQNDKPKWYEEMKIGPAWSNTFEDSFQGTKRVAALKGILLDLGEKHRALFDTETLRLVSAYQGDWNWAGTPWTGQHGQLISLKDESPIFNTAALPGWADSSGSFDDKREIPGFGNLKDASFKGYYRSGNKIVLNYSVNGAEILETISNEGGTITRSFKVSRTRRSPMTGSAWSPPAA